MKQQILSGILTEDFILVAGKLVLLVRLRNKVLDFKLYPINTFIKDFLKTVKEKDMT